MDTYPTRLIFDSLDYSFPWPGPMFKVDLTAGVMTVNIHNRFICHVLSLPEGHNRNAMEVFLMALGGFVADMQRQQYGNTPAWNRMKRELFCPDPLDTRLRKAMEAVLPSTDEIEEELSLSDDSLATPLPGGRGK